MGGSKCSFCMWMGTRPSLRVWKVSVSGGLTVFITDQIKATHEERWFLTITGITFGYYFSKGLYTRYEFCLRLSDTIL